MLQGHSEEIPSIICNETITLMKSFNKAFSVTICQLFFFSIKSLNKTHKLI